METARTNLINAVERERIKLQMSDRKFSNHVLGISPSYWCLIKKGTRSLTLNILTNFMQKLPGVTPEVTFYIMRQGNDGGREKPSPKMGGKGRG